MGGLKSNGIVARAMQSVKGMIRKDDSKLTGRKMQGASWSRAPQLAPWIAELAGFRLSRFEVGQDGKTAHERLMGKSAKVQGMMFAEGILWKKRHVPEVRSESPFACGGRRVLWCQDDHRRVHSGRKAWLLARERGQDQTGETTMEPRHRRSMIVRAP